MTPHDPCPSAVQVTHPPTPLPAAWLHPTPVTCGSCRRQLRYAWWNGTAHVCGRCQDYGVEG